MTFMDLTTQHPRSANEMMAGLVSLARMTDKARASIDGTLGDYHFDCPHDARTQVAPGRSDIVTWFDVLDLDEGRTVAHAHA